MEEALGPYASFLDLAFQTAWRRFNHRKHWNVIIHVVTSWFAAWPLLVMGACFLPYYIHLLLTGVKLLICLAQDQKLGAVYSCVYIILAYDALTTETTFTRAAVMVIIVIGFQIMVGHFLVENDQPVVLERKGDVLLIIVSIMNDLFLAPFHFTVLLLMRYNMLPELHWKSDQCLKKLIEEYSGKKSP